MPKPGAPETVELEIPFLTTRDTRLGSDGRPRYSTDTAEVSAGVCSLIHRRGEELDPRFHDYRASTADAVISGLDAQSQHGLLVYIHGYNIGLGRACEQAAIVAKRTGFEGRLLLFSWPASRTVLTYRKDERRLTESMPAIISVLGDLSQRFGAGNVNVIAHSMGSRAVTAEIEAIALGESLDDLILIAPDIDRDIFVEALPTLKDRFRRISVLVTDSDRLLLLSQSINRGQRLGRATDFEDDGVEVIDVTGLEDLGFGNHVYHLKNDKVGDMLRLILAD